MQKRNSSFLPVQEFEEDTVTVAEKAAQESIKTFAADSRDLFMSNNINIGERPANDSLFFIVMDSVFESTLLQFYGTRKDTLDGKAVISVGEFYDKEIAVQALLQIKSQHPGLNAIISRRRRH